MRRRIHTLPFKTKRYNKPVVNVYIGKHKSKVSRLRWMKEKN